MKYSWWDRIAYGGVQRAYQLTCQLRSLHIHYSWYQRQMLRSPEATKSTLYLQTMLTEYRDNIERWLHLIRLWRWLDDLRWVLSPSRAGRATMERVMEHRLVWVQVVLHESQLLLSELEPLYVLGDDKGDEGKRSYEFIGWIPRSITRTLDRFQRELSGRSRGLRIADYRLLRYQALASLQFLCVVTLFCWGSAKLWHWLWFQPVLQTLWAYRHDYLFIDTWQAHLARADWAQISKLRWLEEISTLHTGPLHPDPWQATDLIGRILTEAMALAEARAWAVLEHIWWVLCALLISFLVDVG